MQSSMSDEPRLHNNSPPDAKIALFRSLFRGREDVYPLRFESRKTGKTGYQPACANEWVKGLCEKRRVKCAKCPNRRFLPVTDEVIRRHLSGQDDIGRDFVMGIYPMLLDETCFLLAVDFDKKSWQEDIAAFIKTCLRLDVPAVLERSRSGNGGHVWLFFNGPVQTALARKLAAHLLTETMEKRPANAPIRRRRTYKRNLAICFHFTFPLFFHPDLSFFRESVFLFAAARLVRDSVFDDSVDQHLPNAFG